MRALHQVGFNKASHEHTVLFCDGTSQTSLHLRLNHLPFLDWDVLPRRCAAIAEATAAAAAAAATSGGERSGKKKRGGKKRRKGKTGRTRR